MMEPVPACEITMSALWINELMSEVNGRTSNVNAGDV